MLYVEHIAWIYKCWLPGEKNMILIAHAWGYVCIDNGYISSSQDIMAQNE